MPIEKQTQDQYEETQALQQILSIGQEQVRLGKVYPLSFVAESIQASLMERLRQRHKRERDTSPNN